MTSPNSRSVQSSYDPRHLSSGVGVGDTRAHQEVREEEYGGEGHVGSTGDSRGRLSSVLSGEKFAYGIKVYPGQKKDHRKVPHDGLLGTFATKTITRSPAGSPSRGRVGKGSQHRPQTRSDSTPVRRHDGVRVLQWPCWA